MKQMRSLMGMHITIEVIEKNVKSQDIDKIYDYFTYVDEKFSTYKETSEISQINKGELREEQYSADMKTVLALCEQTKKETNGYFDICHSGKLDPTGLVKGWAIQQAASFLRKRGIKDFYVDAGGDVQVTGKNNQGKPWVVGIRNPFNSQEIVKVISLNGGGVATSGTAMRGQHIYNPYNPKTEITDIVSLSVIGPNAYEADRFATAAFAMGAEGIYFIEKLPGFEAYLIDRNGIATYTSGFSKLVLSGQYNLN